MTPGKSEEPDDFSQDQLFFLMKKLTNGALVTPTPWVAEGS